MSVKELYHLSHIDLDGYGCQLVSEEFCKKGAFSQVFFYNANYGKEVGVRIHQILEAIRQSSHKSIYLLITDLNLTLAECEELKRKILDFSLNGKNITLELFDHHKSGLECANKHDWYFLDVKRCATKILYDVFCGRYSNLLDDKSKEWLEPTVRMINTIDLWLETDFGFEFGKVALRLIAEARELNRLMFDDEDRLYKLTLLRCAAPLLFSTNGHITLDNSILEFKKNFLNGSLESDTLDNLVSAYQVRLLTQKASMCSVYWGEKKGFLSYAIGNISVLANAFLKANPSFDFFMDLSPKGNVSLRANNQCDVSVLANECFNGGGHPNASGGRLENFRESFLYEDIRAYVQEILDDEDE